MDNVERMPARSDGEHVVNRLMAFYRGLSLNSLAALDDLYTQDVEFVDPVHSIRGTLALKSYFRGMLENMSSYGIEYSDCLHDAESAYLTWKMSYTHPSLNGDRPITLRGMSHVRFTARIFYHEDSYDMGALLYEHVPVLGAATRWLKKRTTG